MGYQVWNKQYGEEWHLTECADLEEAKATIMEAFQIGQEVKLTQELRFDLKLTIKEPKEEKKEDKVSKGKTSEVELKEDAKSEASDSTSKPDKSPRG